MTSAGAIKFYANHLYPGRCSLRSSRFSTPTFRSVNHFSHPFFNETEMQKHEKLSPNERDAFVLMYTAHTCTYHGCLSFIFIFHASHFATRQDKKRRKGMRKVDPRSRENYRRRRQETGSILAMGSSLTNDWNVNWPTISLFHLIIWIHSSRVDPLEK